MNIPFAILLLWISILPVHALEIGPEATFSWQKVRGQASDISANAQGTIYATGKDGIVWRWRNEQARWSKISGEMKRIAVDPKGRPWAVGVNNNLYRRNGLWWDELKEQATDVAIGYEGTVARCDLDGQIYVKDKFSNRWKIIYGRKAVRIAVTGKETLWVIQPDKSISRFDGKFWQDVEGSAIDLATDPNGNVYSISGQGVLRKWIKGHWEDIKGTQNAVSFTVGADGYPWYVAQTGDIFASSLFAPKENEKTQEESTRPTAVSSEQITDTSPLIFTKVNGKTTRLSIGADGSIFAIGVDGTLQRWNNQRKKFITFPGSLSRVAVDLEGNPWGVNAKQKIFYHTGNDWKNISGSAVDISISTHGDIVISNGDEKLYRLNDSKTSFKKIYGKGYYIAAHPNGEIWTITQDGKIRRCSDKECIRLKKKGADIAIGPDGSVYMADVNNKLYVFDLKKDDWKRVETSRSVMSVAVGPKGRPWISDVNYNTYSSMFFERDESEDIRQANTTNKTTTIVSTTSSVRTSIFTFTKKLSFTEVILPFNIADNVSTGLDDIVYFWGDGGSAHRQYQDSTKSAVSLDFSFPESTILAVNDAESRAWFLSSQDDNRIGHQKKKESSNFDFYNFDSATGIGLDLAIGGDGTVFAVSSTNTLYQFNKSKNKFEKISNADVTNVAVDIGGNPWVIEKTTQLVKYWNGSGFVKPNNKTRTASVLRIGASGKIYIIDTNNKIMKWNTSNQQWDTVTISTTVNGVDTADKLAIASDGRPWMMDTSASSSAFRSND